MIGLPFCNKFKNFNNTVAQILGIFHAFQLLLAELGVYVSISISIFFSVIALLSMRFVSGFI